MIKNSIAIKIVMILIVFIAICLFSNTLIIQSDIIELFPQNHSSFKIGVRTSFDTPLYDLVIPGNNAIQVTNFAGGQVGTISEVWQWKEDQFIQVLYKDLSAIPDLRYCRVWLPSNKMLLYQYNEIKKIYFSIIDISEMQVIKDMSDWCKNWWTIDEVCVSNNGSYIAFVMDYVSYVGGQWDKLDVSDYPVKLSLYNTQCEKIHDAITLTPNEGIGSGCRGGNINDIYCTDDGFYIALAGRGWGTTYVDAKSGTFLWEIRPKSCSMMNCVVISPDGSRVYSGSKNGIFYEFDGPTGKLLKEADFSSLVGTRDQLGGVGDMIVSPDGNWIALMSGNLFLYSTKMDKILFWIDMSGRTKEAVFSPDSKQIAVFMDGKVNTYKIPEIIIPRYETPETKKNK